MTGWTLLLAIACLFGGCAVGVRSERARVDQARAALADRMRRELRAGVVLR